MAYYLYPVKSGAPDDVFLDITVNRSIEEVLKGLLISPDAVAQPIRITSKHRRVPDLISFNAYYYGVSLACLELLEKYSASDIATFPISIVDRLGATIAGKHFFLNVLAVRDSIVLDETNTSSITTKAKLPDGSPDVVRRIDRRKLKVRRAAAQGAHVWREKAREFATRIFFSDEFVGAARQRQLSGFEYCIPVAEI